MRDPRNNPWVGACVWKSGHRPDVRDRFVVAIESDGTIVWTKTGLPGAYRYKCSLKTWKNWCFSGRAGESARWDPKRSTPNPCKHPLETLVIHEDGSSGDCHCCSHVVARIACPCGDLSLSGCVNVARFLLGHVKELSK